MKPYLVCILLLIAAGTFSTADGQVPDTGQTKCFGIMGEIVCPQAGEPFYGQDAQNHTAQRSFTKLDGQGSRLPDNAPSWSMVRDDVTGLVWEVKQAKNGAPDYDNPHDADNSYIWFDDNASRNGGNSGNEGAGRNTKEFIATLNKTAFGGFADWRLPTAKELVWLLDRGLDGPPYISAGFLPGVAEEYWTSTTDPSGSSRCATVTLTIGMMNYPEKAESYAAMAVRGSSPIQQFRDNGDGTVSDLTTGLMWQKDSIQGISWQASLAYCQNLKLGGYTDWRLPDVNELISLVDYSRTSPSIDDTFFNNTLLHYWSSTTYPSKPGMAYHVCFLRGRAEVYDKFDNGLASHMRAVRGIVSDNSSTTTTVPGSSCPVEKLYGQNAPETRLLRNFRDEVLASTATGRTLIECYYRLSPMMNRYIANPSVKTALRAACDGIIAALVKTGF